MLVAAGGTSKVCNLVRYCRRRVSRSVAFASGGPITPIDPSPRSLNFVAPDWVVARRTTGSLCSLATALAASPIFISVLAIASWTSLRANFATDSTGPLVCTIARRTEARSVARTCAKAAANCESSKPDGPTARDNVTGRVIHRHDQPTRAAHRHPTIKTRAHRHARPMFIDLGQQFGWSEILNGSSEQQIS